MDSDTFLGIRLLLMILWNVLVFYPISKRSNKEETMKNMVYMNIARLVGIFIVDFSNYNISIGFDFFGLIFTALIYVFINSKNKGPLVKSNNRVIYRSNNKMKCPNCGSSIPYDMNICTYCKKSTQVVYGQKICPSCGGNVGKYATTCPNCKSKISTNNQDKSNGNNDDSYKKGEQEYISENENK